VLPAKPGEVAREAVCVGLPESAGQFPPDASIASVTSSVHSATYSHDAQRRFAEPPPGAQ